MTRIWEDTLESIFGKILWYSRCFTTAAELYCSCPAAQVSKENFSQSEGPDCKVFIQNNLHKSIKVAVFKDVHSVMVIVDLWPELWDDALHKFESELGNFILDEEQSS